MRPCPPGRAGVTLRGQMAVERKRKHQEPGGPRLEPSAATPERALHDLAASAGRRAYLIAYDLLGDRAEAEEAVQEALARACASIERLREPDAARAWFFRVLVNVCRRWLRRRRLRQALVGWFDSDDRVGRSPEAELDRGRDLEAVLRGLRHLSYMQRTALLLRYGHGMAVAEVAAVLGVGAETVKTHLGRGLRRLRAEVAPHTENDDA
jgi:RNA polymerase sigma-70 factor, ECF subfamily